MAHCNKDKTWIFYTRTEERHGVGFLIFRGQAWFSNSLEQRSAEGGAYYVCTVQPCPDESHLSCLATITQFAYFKSKLSTEILISDSRQADKMENKKKKGGVTHMNLSALCIYVQCYTT